MAFWNRRQRTNLPSDTPPAPPASSLDLGQALEIVLVKSVESQANVASQIGQLVTNNVVALTEMQQDAYKRASRKRGGRIRSGSAKRTRGGQFARGCRLCENPTIGDPTKEEIIAHINHQNPGLHYREENGAIVVDADESQIQTNAQGEQVIECEDCLTGKEHSHGQH